VDCDPDPNLADTFGVEPALVKRWTFEGLRRVPGTLALAAEPPLVEVEPGRLWLLAGPSSPEPLNDAVARGIAGVLVAERFDHVVTDLGAGPEYTRMAVGGVLNPADLCLVLSDGRPAADLAAGRIEGACRARGVPARRVLIEPQRKPTAAELLVLLDQPA
jgi:hypothetical protein